MPNYPTVHGELSALWDFIGNLQLLSRAASNSTSQLETDVNALEDKTQCISHINTPTNSTLISCDLIVSGSTQLGDTATDETRIKGNAHLENNLIVSGSTQLGDTTGDTVTIKGVSADNTVTSILGINGSNIVKTRTVQSIVDEATNLGYVYYNIDDTNYNAIYTLASTTKVLEINCTMTIVRGLGPLPVAVWIEAEPYELGRRLIIVNSLNSTQKFRIENSVAVNAYNPVIDAGSAGLEFYIGTSMELVLVKSNTPGQTKVWKTLNTAALLDNA